MNKRFTYECLEMSISIDNFFKLEFALITYFIDHYTVNKATNFSKEVFKI